jgi:hypothetical protein
MRIEYSRENPRICSTLDDYGFPYSLCGRESRGVPEIPTWTSCLA